MATQDSATSKRREFTLFMASPPRIVGTCTACPPLPQSQSLRQAQDAMQVCEQARPETRLRQASAPAHSGAACPIARVRVRVRVRVSARPPQRRRPGWTWARARRRAAPRAPPPASAAACPGVTAPPPPPGSWARSRRSPAPRFILETSVLTNNGQQKAAVGQSRRSYPEV